MRCFCNCQKFLSFIVSHVPNVLRLGGGQGEGLRLGEDREVGWTGCIAVVRGWTGGGAKGGGGLLMLDV